MCGKIVCKIVITAANQHKENGHAERANRSLREVHEQLSMVDHRCLKADTIAEANLGKK